MSHYDQIEDILARHHVGPAETKNERGKESIDAIIADLKKLNAKIGFKAVWRNGTDDGFRLLDYLK